MAEEQFKLQRCLIENPARELRFLDQLVESHDDPENPVVITEADLQSKKGQRLLKKLKVDEYLGGDAIDLSTRLTRFKTELQRIAYSSRWNDFNSHEVLLWIGDDVGIEKNDGFFLQDHSLYTKQRQGYRYRFLDCHLGWDPSFKKLYREHRESFDDLFYKLGESFAHTVPNPRGLDSADMRFFLSEFSSLIQENPQEFFALFDDTDQTTHYVLYLLHLLNPENLEEARSYLPSIKAWSKKVPGALFFRIDVVEEKYVLTPEYPHFTYGRNGERHLKDESGHSLGMWKYRTTGLNFAPLLVNYPEKMLELMDEAEDSREIGGCLLGLALAQQGSDRITDEESLMSYGLAGMKIFQLPWLEDSDSVTGRGNLSFGWSYGDDRSVHVYQLLDILMTDNPLKSRFIHLFLRHPDELAVIAETVGKDDFFWFYATADREEYDFFYAFKDHPGEVAAIFSSINIPPNFNSSFIADVFGTESFHSLITKHPSELAELFKHFGSLPFYEEFYENFRTEGRWSHYRDSVHEVFWLISSLIEQGWTMEELLEIAHETKSGALAAFVSTEYRDFAHDEDSREFLLLVGQIARDSGMDFSIFYAIDFFKTLDQFSNTEELRAFHVRYGVDSVYAILAMAKAHLPSPGSKRSDDYARKGAKIAKNLRENGVQPQDIRYVFEVLDSETLSRPVDELLPYTSLLASLVAETQSGSTLIEIFNGLTKYTRIDTAVLQALTHIDLSTTEEMAEKLKKDPDIGPLVSLLSKRSGKNLFIVSKENYEDISHLAQFFGTLGVRGSEIRGLYLNSLDFSKAVEELSDAPLHRIVRYGRMLDSIDPKLGKNLIQIINPPARLKEDQIVEVTEENLNEVFNDFYVLKCLELSLPEFVFSLSGSGEVASLADIILQIEQLSKISDMPGGEEFAQSFSFENIDWKTIDLTSPEGFSVNYFNLEQIEALRLHVNEYTGNVGGDKLVAQLARGFVDQDITPDNLISFVRFARVWKKTDVLSTYLLDDIEGRYHMASNWAATKARDFVETHYDTCHERPDFSDIMAELEELGYPVREELIAPFLAHMRMAEELKSETATAIESESADPEMTEEELLSALSPEDKAFLEELEAIRDAQITLSQPLFSELRLNDIEGLEAFRLRANRVTNNGRGDHVILLLYQSEFGRDIDLSRVDIEFGIFKALRDVPRSEPFGRIYRTLSEFVGNRLILFIRNNQELCREHFADYEEIVSTLATHGFSIPEEVSDIDKMRHHVENGNFGYIAGKIKTKTQQAALSVSGAGDLDAEYVEGALTEVPIPGALEGYEIKKVRINGRHVATVIYGDHEGGARVTARIKVGGGIRESEVSESFGDTITYQSPVTLVSGNNKGVALMANQGTVLNPSFAPDSQDGYLIIYPDGTLHIANKWDLRLSDLTRRSSDRSVQLRPMESMLDYLRMKEEIRSHGLTILASTLLEDTGIAGHYTQKPYGNDSRRFLIEFYDGRFGMIDSEERMSLNDLAAIAYRLGAKSLLYCDTGNYDLARYYTYPNGRKTPTLIGLDDAENSSNRVIFYQEEEEE